MKLTITIIVINVLWLLVTGFYAMSPFNFILALVIIPLMIAWFYSKKGRK